MWPIQVSSEMDVEVNGSKIVENDSSDLDMEAQEDILMLKAHMGEVYHLLEDSANTEHLLDRSQFLPSKNVEAVSYTHLDVYKRQVIFLDLTRRLWEFANFGVPHPLYFT